MDNDNWKQNDYFALSLFLIIMNDFIIIIILWLLIFTFILFQVLTKDSVTVSVDAVVYYRDLLHPFIHSFIYVYSSIYSSFYPVVYYKSLHINPPSSILSFIHSFIFIYSIVYYMNLHLFINSHLFIHLFILIYLFFIRKFTIRSFLQSFILSVFVF